MLPIGGLIAKAAIEALAFGVAYDAYTTYVQPYLDDFIGDESLSESGTGGGITDSELLEDMVKTQKALLQYHEVREDIYTPLNIDST